MIRHDAIEVGNVLMYMEATEKGYLGVMAGLGRHKGVWWPVYKIGLRSGVGDILAEGTERAATFGHPEIAMTVKGMSIPAYDPRGIKGWDWLCHQQPRRLPPAGLYTCGGSDWQCAGTK
jgi:aldehyde:ferredoxin oxidoreductase